MLYRKRNRHSKLAPFSCAYRVFVLRSTNALFLLSIQSLTEWTFGAVIWALRVKNQQLVRAVSRKTTQISENPETSQKIVFIKRRVEICSYLLLNAVSRQPSKSDNGKFAHSFNLSPFYQTKAWLSCDNNSTSATHLITGLLFWDIRYGLRNVFPLQNKKKG